MLHFDPATGFYADDTETVRAAVAADWVAAFHKDGQVDLNTDPETPAGQLIDSQTAAVTEKDTELLYLCNQFDPAKNEGIFQDALARVYFITRKPAAPSRAVITVRGLSGTVIPVNAQVMSSADDTIWQNVAAFTIGADGTGSGIFECTTEGLISAAAGTLTRIMTVVAGWDTATNATAATVGTLKENRGQFELRRYASVALNSRGTAASVYARVMQLDDVIGCVVRENKTNQPKVVDGITLSPHSVYVCVLGGENWAIATAMYKTVSAGCDTNGTSTYTVEDPSTGIKEPIHFQRPTDVGVTIRLKFPDVASLSADDKATIRQAVFNNFYGEDPTVVDGSIMARPMMGDTIYAPRFAISVQNAGYTDLLDVDVAKTGGAWADALYIKIDENPELSLADIVIE